LAAAKRIWNSPWVKVNVPLAVGTRLADECASLPDASFSKLTHCERSQVEKTGHTAK
jgi:hypothetical protein